MSFYSFHLRDIDGIRMVSPATQPQPVQAAFPLSCHAAPKQRATERSRCGFRGPPCHDVDHHEHYHHHDHQQQEEQ